MGTCAFKYFPPLPIAPVKGLIAELELLRRILSVLILCYIGSLAQRWTIHVSRPHLFLMLRLLTCMKCCCSSLRAGRKNKSRDKHQYASVEAVEINWWIVSGTDWIIPPGPVCSRLSCFALLTMNCSQGRMRKGRYLCLSMNSAQHEVANHFTKV